MLFYMNINLLKMCHASQSDRFCDRLQDDVDHMKDSQLTRIQFSLSVDVTE